MTARAALLQLRDRLRAATGPDEELELELARVAGWLFGGGRPSGGTWRDPGGRRYGWFGAPPFTSSIDAAVTLVPDEFRNFWSCGDESGPAKLFARYGYCDETTALTVPLALCLARVEYELAKMAPE